MMTTLALAWIAAGLALAGENDDFWSLVEAEIDASNPDRPYTMVIVCDPAARARAADARATILAVDPFRRMGGQLNIVISELDGATMNCRPDSVRERIVGCDMDPIARVGADLGAHQTLAVTSLAAGGSGGPIPILGTGNPPHTLLHELGHSYGLGDEYEYRLPDEWRRFCMPPIRSPNITSIQPLAAGYRTDATARTRHGGEIPWFGAIASTTLITTGFNLGTSPGIFPADAAGLYRGGECDKVVPTWKPYAQNTVMNNVFEAGGGDVFPVHSAQIRSRIEAQLGRVVTLIDPTSVASPVPMSAQGVGAVPPSPPPAPPPAKNPTGGIGE